MKKIAILGSDSSHVEAFTKLINLPKAPFRSRARVVSIWGEDIQQTASKANDLGIFNVCNSPEQALAGVNYVFVLGRFPESHYSPAKLALEKGLSTFVDKPFVNDSKHAEELMGLAQKQKAKLMSCSAYRFSREIQKLRGIFQKQPFKSAVMTGPRECNDLGPDPRFKDLFFYGVHAVEALLQIFGDDIIDIKASSSDRGTFAVLKYRNGFHCGLNFLTDLPGEFYHVIGFNTGDPIQSTFNLDAEKDLYEREVGGILDYFEKGIQTVDPRSNLMAIKIIEEIKKC